METYLETSYPDADREYVDGVVVERNVGAPAHSALLKILVVHLSGFEKEFGISVFPSCRTRTTETQYRVPDVVVMKRPYRKTDQPILDAPWIIVEVLSRRPPPGHPPPLRRVRAPRRHSHRADGSKIEPRSCSLMVTSFGVISPRSNWKAAVPCHLTAKRCSPNSTNTICPKSRGGPSPFRSPTRTETGKARPPASRARSTAPSKPSRS